MAYVDISTPTPLDIFNWAVVRQSDIGPGARTCAEAFNITTREVRDIVAQWNDPRGHMECVQVAVDTQRLGSRLGGFWRIEAYYNTSGRLT